MVSTKQPNIVKDYTTGNTRVKIADDFCRDKTEVDVNTILKRIAHRAQGVLSVKVPTI